MARGKRRVIRSAVSAVSALRSPRSLRPLRLNARSAPSYCSVKLTVAVMITGTGWPLSSVGANSH
jgi:hypothetical protein